MPLQVLAATQAFDSLKWNRGARWPDGRRANNGRLGAFASVGLKPRFQFSRDDAILTIGSCFAREIESRLVALGFDVPMTRVQIPAAERTGGFANNVLNKYVPPAMLNELRWSFDPASVFPDAAYLEVDGGLWHDPHLSTNLLPAPLARVKERRAHVMQVYAAAKKARIVIITLGLSEAWFDRELGLYLNDTPPMPAVTRQPSRFEMHLLSYEDVMVSLEGILATLSAFGHPDFRILLTVSPVPFKATFSGVDAMQANAYSKAVLRTAAEAFCSAHPGRVDYFPSFETVTLSDRSLSYHLDNIHVRRQMVARIMDAVVGRYTDVQESGGDDPPGAAGQPNHAQALFAYAQGLARAEDFEAATQVMRNVAETFGDAACGMSPSDFHHWFGTWLARARRLDLALGEFARSVKLQPANDKAHFGQGVALSKLKRHEEALVAFGKAAELQPGSVRYAWRLGEEYLRASNPAAAREWLERARAIEPGHQETQDALQRLARDAAASAAA